MKIDLRAALIALGICAAVALLASLVLRLSFLVLFGITISALLLNGLVAAFEQDDESEVNAAKEMPRHMQAIRYLIWAAGAGIVAMFVWAFFAK